MDQTVLPQPAEHLGERGAGRPGHGQRDGAHAAGARPVQLPDQAFQREQLVRGEVLEMLEHQHQHRSAVLLRASPPEQPVGQLNLR
ncbi:hypothetical protein [Streptomyces sp. A30]|uniref:hypothetical protein n=1 Tax=Streptomyces sp. A30 TaxID=2789273 RepID=UPI003980004E